MLVSILTPTFNRKLFIPQYFNNIYRQDYLGKIEILIADDGADTIEDIIPNDIRIKYFKFAEKKTLGYKRNFLAKNAQGDILVNFDDDDFYPPKRISHAISALQKSDLQIAGSSRIYIYNSISQTISESGPFGENHATAGTLAFKRSYIEKYSFDETRNSQEEPSFTSGFTEPMVQLEPKSTILVIQHKRNTWDKTNTTSTLTNYKLRDFISDKNTIRFYKKLGRFE